MDRAIVKNDIRYRGGISSSVIEVIGGTPLVELSRAGAGINGRILGKLEYLNPGHSKKDRVARQIIEEAEQQGRLKTGQTVVELTSGNTGTGLAIVCAVKGYPFVAVMSRGNSTERARMMRALGAEVVLVDQAEGGRAGEVTGADLDLVATATERLTIDRGAFRADQFSLKASSSAHLLHTGPEILEQSQGKFDAFCDFVGSGGTLAGCSAAFKAFRSDILCYAVEPAGAAVLSGGDAVDPNHPIQGGGYAKTHLPLLQDTLIDGYLQVSGDDAREASRWLAQKEGIFAGFSAGANYAAARGLLCTSLPGATIVILACDSGMKYLSTDLWPGG